MPPVRALREQPFITLLTTLAALDLGLFVWYLNATIIRRPFWDMYSYVLHYLDYRANGGWWTYLWQPHDLHRPVWSRLLTAFDIQAFSGVSYPFIISSTALQLTTAWLLWRECRAGVPGRLGWALGCVVLMLVLTSVAAVDCAIPIECAYPQALAFTVLAIVLFDGGEDPGMGNRYAIEWRRGAALLAAIGAPLGNAVGLAAWPILLWVAWRGRTGRAWMMTIAGVGLVFIVLYLPALSIASTAGTLATGQGIADVGYWARRANYLLTYLGLPWTRATALLLPGRVLGAVLLGAGVSVVLWRGVFRAPTGRLERISVALIMFSLASALLATVGRVNLAQSDGVLVPVRYSVLLAPLHVGLLWITSPWLTRLWSNRRSWPAVAVGITVACVLLLAQQVAAGEAAVATTRRMRATIERFEAGETDPTMTSVIYVDLNQARRELAMIRGAGLYVDLK
jgi:hypothetical protein